MRSTWSFGASVILLLALPLAILCQNIFGIEAEMVFHFELSIGFSLLMPIDFNSPNWITRLGRAASFFLGWIFALQFLAQLTDVEFLNWLGFQILGQWPESLFVDLLLIWLVGLLLTDSAGKTRILGFICVPPAVAVKIYSYILPAVGTTLDEQLAALKILLLLPFVWLLFESKRNGQT